MQFLFRFRVSSSAFPLPRFLFRVSSSAFPFPLFYRFSVSISGTYQKDRQ